MHYFKCEKCDYEVNNKVDMDVHKKTHDNIPFKCNLCVFVGDSLNNLKVHIENDHGRLNCNNKCKDYEALEKTTIN